MISAEKSVYISYSWKKEKRKKTVEKIMAAFSAVGVEVKRDEKEIGYGDPIRAYMDELAAGGAIILVLSEPYIKSPNCMYELLEIYNHDRKKFCERIIPVVLKETRFHKAIDRLPYIRFWEEETKRLKAELGSVDMTNIGTVSHQELRKYVEVSNKIDDLLSLIGDMNHLKEEDHLKDNFSALIERIFPALPPSGGGGADKTDREKAASNQSVDIDQNIVGNGNISSGSGNITIGNVTIYAAGTAKQPETTASLISPAKLGTLFGVPDPPPNHFDRPEYLDQLRAAVLQGDTQAVGTTGKRQYVGVLGMGGLGKSVLAAALAHDEAVRAAFPDGIFWLRFRQNADDAYLLEQQAEILKIIAPGQLPDTLVNGENLLTLALEDKCCLFIADDIWDSGQLYHFKLKSKHCRLLLTTRKAEVIKKINAVACELGLLSEPQARQFFAVCSGCAENNLPEEAAAIVQECGRLPLALAAIGSMVKDKPAKRWQTALEKLQNARLDKIPADLTLDYEYKNLFKVLQVSVEDLPPEVQAYYKTLIIFHEDEKVPEDVIDIYWNHCGNGDYEPSGAVCWWKDRSLFVIKISY
ncbi:NB-ARC domain-containing protein [Candidatus Electronema sp. PJ]|uniref:toll/interleukin-1 receptor domain-containing protein n=1 Tax=Candidatus Electronema sp. PJ TaxID=3401572 RepID=UPI003AA7D719